jgi:hypothetical protein
MRSVRNAVLNPNTREEIEVVLKRDMPIGRVVIFFTGLLSLLAPHEVASVPDTHGCDQNKYQGTLARAV